MGCCSSSAALRNIGDDFTPVAFPPQASGADTSVTTVSTTITTSTTTTTTAKPAEIQSLECPSLNRSHRKGSSPGPTTPPLPAAAEPAERLRASSLTCIDILKEREPLPTTTTATSITANLTIPMLAIPEKPTGMPAPPNPFLVPLQPTMSPVAQTSGSALRRRKLNRASSSQLHHYLRVAALLRTQLHSPRPNPLSPPPSLQLPQLRPSTPELEGEEEARLLTFTMPAAVSLLLRENVVSSVEEGTQLVLALETMNVLRRQQHQQKSDTMTSPRKALVFQFVNDVKELECGSSSSSCSGDLPRCLTSPVPSVTSCGDESSLPQSVTLPSTASLRLQYDEREQCFMIPPVDMAECSEASAVASDVLTTAEELLLSSQQSLPRSHTMPAATHRSAPIQIPPTSEAMSPNSQSSSLAKQSSLTKQSSLLSPTLLTYTRMGRYTL